jgi:solute carrier family 25 protein 16
VKILFQASNPEFQKYAGTWSGVFRAGSAIYKESGTWGLFQGHSAALIRVFPYAAIKFIAYDQVHHVRYLSLQTERCSSSLLVIVILKAVLSLAVNAHSSTRNTLETVFCRCHLRSISIHQSLLLGCANDCTTGIISVFFTYPLELIRVRMAYETKRSSTSNHASNGRPSFVRAISHIYNEGATSESSSAPKRLFQRYPILKFYRGFTVTVAGMVPYAGTSFLTWGFLRAQFIPEGSKKLTPVADLGFGAISGILSQTASYPFEIIRRRMQIGGLRKPETWMTWSETVREIWRKGGWRGFYVGLSIGYLKIVPMTAISFSVWQAGKNILGV